MLYRALAAGDRATTFLRKDLALTTTTLILLILLGLGVGVLGGTMGIGGGILFVPALVFLLNFKHDEAVGTSVAILLPPIGFLAAVTYWRAGMVNIPVAGILAITFAIGAWLGSMLVTSKWLPVEATRVMFGLFLIYIACQMLFHSNEMVWAASRTIIIVSSAAAMHFLARAAGRRWTRRLPAHEVFVTQRRRPFAIDYEI